MILKKSETGTQVVIWGRIESKRVEFDRSFVIGGSDFARFGLVWAALRGLSAFLLSGTKSEERFSMPFRVLRRRGDLVSAHHYHPDYAITAPASTTAHIQDNVFLFSFTSKLCASTNHVLG